MIWRLVRYILVGVALEASGVVIVQTETAKLNGTRSTHVWFVRNGGRLYLEAGDPQNGWVRDLEAIETLRLLGGQLDGEYRFAVVSGPEAHQQIRGWMRTKYGWRDTWIGLLIDTTRSQLVALDPV